MNVTLSSVEQESLEALRQMLKTRSGLPVSRSAALGYAITHQFEIEKGKQPASPMGVRK